MRLAIMKKRATMRTSLKGTSTTPRIMPKRPANTTLTITAKPPDSNVRRGQSIADVVRPKSDCKLRVQRRPRSQKTQHTLGVDDDHDLGPLPSPVLQLGHFNQALVGHF